MMKVLMSWDIRSGREAEYFEFAVKEFAPGLNRLGLQTSEVWYTLYGDCPQMLHGCVAEDLPTIQKILKTDEWRELITKLGEYVTDFHQKVVQATGNFQL